MIGHKATVDGFDFELSEDDALSMIPGCDALRALRGPAGYMFVERRLSMEAFIPTCFGTADAVVIPEGGESLVIDDYKSGHGHEVQPDGNFQLMLYAAGALTSLPADVIAKVKRVFLRIDQPPFGDPKVWETTPEMVTDFAHQCGAAAEKIVAGDTVYAPSEDNCRWCDAKASCPAAAKRMVALCDFRGAAPKRVAKPLSPYMRSKVLLYKDEIESWLKALHAAALEDAIAGRPTPGFKAVEGRRGNRQWVDEAFAEEVLVAALGDGAYAPKKVMSPAQAEKAVKKYAKGGNPENVLPPTVQAQGRPCLVSEDDERPSITLFD
tara:strand:- start:7537 stop:8505 length:969 start_codon:yes stop_codon:yes gene_type:complete